MENLLHAGFQRHRAAFYAILSTTFGMPRTLSAEIEERIARQITIEHAPITSHTTPT